MIAGERNGESWDALKHAAIFNRRHPGMIELVILQAVAQCHHEQTSDGPRCFEEQIESKLDESP